MARPASRVLVDLSVAPPGGAGTYAAGFARGLVEADLDDKDSLVVLVDRSWAPAHEPVIADLRRVGVAVDALELAAPGSWRARLERGRITRAAVARHAADVAYFPRDVVPVMRRPYVLLANNLYAWERFSSSEVIGGPLPAYLLRRQAHRSALRAAAVLAVSQVMADALTDDVEVAGIVHHGCALPESDPEQGCGGGGGGPTAIMVGNVMANKGITTAIDGVGAARQRGHRWHLKVYGAKSDPGCADRLEAQARAVLEAPVLQGPVSRADLADAYRGADVVLVGGTFESFCFPLVEAMRSGCVVVAPASPLVDEVCGPVAVTYREGDPASLARALEVAWTERHRRRADGISRSRRYRWPDTVARTIAHVRSVVPG